MTWWTGDVLWMVSTQLDVAIAAKATILLALGLAATPLARRARASVRHLILAATFGTVFVLPFVVRTVPTVDIPVPVLREQRPEGQRAGERASRAPAASAGAAVSDPASRARASFATLIRTVWAAGAAFLVAVWAIDLRRLRTLRRGGLPWPAQKERTRSLAIACGVRRSVDVLLHEDVRSPLTFGVWQPTILLPIDATEWPVADLRRALVHELEHVRRGDWATQCVARVVCACYWFHPLAWMAWRRLRLEAERACDDAVVQGAECTEYAEQLVSLARRLSTVRAFPTLAIANRSDLSERIFSLLDASRRRGRVGRPAMSGVICAACLAVMVVAPVRAIAAREGATPRTLRTRRATEDPARTSAVSRTPATARARARPGSALGDTTWNTQHTGSTFTVVASPLGAGIAEGSASHSAVQSATVRHSSDATSSSGSP